MFSLLSFMSKNKGQLNRFLAPPASRRSVSKKVVDIDRRFIDAFLCALRLLFFTIQLPQTRRKATIVGDKHRFAWRKLPLNCWSNHDKWYLGMDVDISTVAR